MELVNAIQTASRQYCHRQLTWARGLPLFSWVDAEQDQEAVVDQIIAELQSATHRGDLPCFATAVLGSLHATQFGAAHGSQSKVACEGERLWLCNRQRRASGSPFR